MEFFQDKVSSLAVDFGLYVNEFSGGTRGLLAKASAKLSQEQYEAVVVGMAKVVNGSLNKTKGYELLAHALTEAEGPSAENLGLTDWNLDDYWKVEAEVSESDMTQKEKDEFLEMVAQEAVAPVYKLAVQVLESYLEFDSVVAMETVSFEEVGNKVRPLHSTVMHFSGKSKTPEVFSDPQTSTMALSATPFPLV